LILRGAKIVVVDSVCDIILTKEASQILLLFDNNLFDNFSSKRTYCDSVLTSLELIKNVRIRVDTINDIIRLPVIQIRTHTVTSLFF
jgi:hypothetical protein